MLSCEVFWLVALFRKKNSSASCRWFSRAAVLFQGRFWSCWLLADPMYTTERPTETALGGLSDSAVTMATCYSRPPPRSPREPQRMALLFLPGTAGMDLRVVYPSSFLPFFSIMNKFISSPPAEPNPSLLMESPHHYPGTRALNEIFCFCLEGNKASGSNDSSQGQS